MPIQCCAMSYVCLDGFGVSMMSTGNVLRGNSNIIGPQIAYINLNNQLICMNVFALQIPFFNGRGHPQIHVRGDHVVLLCMSDHLIFFNFFNFINLGSKVEFELTHFTEHSAVHTLHVL